MSPFWLHQLLNLQLHGTRTVMLDEKGVRGQVLIRERQVKFDYLGVEIYNTRYFEVLRYKR
jgi:hypothetical protein